MRTRPPEQGRLVAVRLTEIPTGTRLRALEVLLRREDNPLARYDLLMAAHRPSDRVYFLPAEAVARVLSAKSGKPVAASV